MRKVLLFIAASVDGYIAKPNDDLSFLSIVQQEGEDYGYNAFIRGIDTVILGRKTYEWVLRQVPTFPHADKETYVVTRTPRPAEGSVQFYTGDLKELVLCLKGKQGKNIFVDGGADVVHSLLQEGLIDEFYISLIPVLLGEGVRLFKEGFLEQQLRLIDVKSFASGLVQLHYTRANDQGVTV